MENNSFQDYLNLLFKNYIIQIQQVGNLIYIYLILQIMKFTCYHKTIAIRNKASLCIGLISRVDLEKVIQLFLNKMKSGKNDDHWREFVPYQHALVCLFGSNNMNKLYIFN